MDEKTKRKYSYIVAAVPIVITVMQVLLSSAPVAMLGVGVIMGILAFVLFRFLSGIRVFAPGQSHLGQSHTLRVWQAPALWVPVVMGVGVVLFVWLVQ